MCFLNAGELVPAGEPGCKPSKERAGVAAGQIVKLHLETETFAADTKPFPSKYQIIYTLVGCSCLTV